MSHQHWDRAEGSYSITPCSVYVEVLLSYLENDATDLYYHFNVPQGMQWIMLDEWRKRTI